MLRRLRREEDGQILPFVLAFVALFGLSVAGLLGWTTTSFSLARSVRDLGTRVYTADAGAEFAIAQLRADPDAGALETLACASSSRRNQTYTVPLNGDTATVRAEARSGSGICLQDNTSLTAPELTLLALGGPSTSGIDLRSSGVDLSFSGPIHSNGAIVAGPRAVTVTSAGASRPSRASSVSGAGPDCPHLVADVELCGAAAPLPDPRTVLPGSWALPNDLDPSQPGDQTPATVAAGGPVACPPGTSSRIRCFRPGRYSAPPSLTDPTVLYWFLPGHHYFAFSGTWSVEGVAFTAGELKPGVTGPEDVPGACVPPATAQGQPWNHGAQFLFARTAALHVNRAGTTRTRAEICAMPWSDRQRIAIYAVHPSPPSGYEAHSGPLLTTGNNGRAELYVRGTVYGPASDVDLDLKSQGALQVDRGMVVRTIGIHNTPGASTGVPVVSDPPIVTLGRTDRSVVVTSTSGNARIVAVVDLEAATDRPTVRSWTVRAPS